MAFGKTQTGGLARLSDEDNHGYLYAHLSSLAYKPLLGMSPKSWYKMPAKATVVSYRAPKYELGPINLFDKNVRTIDSMKKELKRAKNDSTIDGILLVNPSYGTSFALMQELIEAFRDFKESGKHISVYYDNISNGGYIFSASIADKIYLNPTGMLDLRGIAIASPYLRDLLDSVGVEPINLRSHKYKNAGNMFSESEMTEAEREVYESLLDSIYEQVLASIETGRGDRLIKPIAELVDEGPYVIAQEALDAGLVDKLIYQDELKGELKKDFSFSKERKEMANYHNYEWAKPKENLIAVIYASGNIVMGKGKAGQKIAHQTTVDLIRKARKDPKYKGIILRVDSGGGSAQASDIILRELELAKKENNMPIVVSMAGSAASGGYYIAANADKIVADGTTLTGSIGVIGLAFNASELFKKVKVNWSTVKKGEHADLGALHRPMRDSEKNILESMIEHTYDDFIGIVADGRGMSKDEVHEIAQGRVWTGAQAKDIGLVDALGGMATSRI
ncbi:MAG TPA: signal peptide peptidase SppA [Candidatus Cloacimonetes bacterium]|nr:signal peptide peptidase SppA [Candidatus Cloacimonadota bacterium]